MLVLASTGDILRLVTGQAVTVDVHATYADLAAGVVTPGRKNTAISTQTTTDVVPSPGASTQRIVKHLSARNKHASSSVDTTLVHTDGTTAVELMKVTLAAGEELSYEEQEGFRLFDNVGRVKSRVDAVSAAVNTLNTVVLGSDQTNNNAVANTIQDVTGLSFPVNSGEKYWFYFCIFYTAAATTTGSRWSINGPASPTQLAYSSRYTLTATTETVNYQSTYDAPATSNASSLTAGNVAIMEGIVQPSAAGSVIARFASEVLSSAIVAKAGSFLQWMRVA